MQAISYIKTPLLAGIRQAVCLYFKFTLSLRDVEKILAERAHPGSVCHLDDMVVRINGRQIFMRWTVDQKGEALDILAQKRRNRGAALKMLRKLLRNQSDAPDEVVIDGLPSLRCGARDFGLPLTSSPGSIARQQAGQTRISSMFSVT